MTDLGGFLLQTLTASGVAVLLLILKALFRDKLPPSWQFAVWGVLGIILLLPAGLGGRYVIFHWQLVVELVKGQHQKAIKLLQDNRRKLDEISKYLYEKETITGDEFMALLNAK